ncbi:MAG: septum formation protein Maf [Chloroflexi bacterium]|nr:septum formation protein Maf [Chloroflexota bacterium]
MTSKVVLASRSPRRQEALHALGVSFDVVVSGAEAAMPPPDDPTDPTSVAVVKAVDIHAQRPNDPVLAGDTIVVLDDAGLGKPDSPEAARSMLRALRGRQHAVRTAVAAAGARQPAQPASHQAADQGTLYVAEVACPLLMRPYIDEEIERYVATGEPLDCAGAYDVHRQGGALIAAVQGCFSTVVGLPIAMAARLLHQVGVEVPRDPADVCTALYGRRCLAADSATAPACFAPVRSRPLPER